MIHSSTVDSKWGETGIWTDAVHQCMQELERCLEQYYESPSHQWSAGCIDDDLWLRLWRCFLLGRYYRRRLRSFAWLCQSLHSQINPHRLVCIPLLPEDLTTCFTCFCKRVYRQMPYEQNATALAVDNYCLMANQRAAEQLSTKNERQCEKGEYWCIPDKPEAHHGPPLQQQQVTNTTECMGNSSLQANVGPSPIRTEKYICFPAHLNPECTIHELLLGFLRVDGFRVHRRF
jgi:hypothetical protein